MQRSNKQNNPKTMSPTPLRDWIKHQTPERRLAFCVLFALLIACGGKASISFPFTPIAATSQLLYVLLAGALLGSRSGFIAGSLYLAIALTTGGVLWPAYTGQAPTSGLTAGYLWSIPFVAWTSGYFVERNLKESAFFFALGVAAGIALYNACGTLWLMASLQTNGQDGFLKGVGFFNGLHALHGALSVYIASSASTILQTRGK